MQTRGSSVALSLRGLSKAYGPTLAVDRLDLDVPRGSFFGLVGPNGAGKTTTLSMATGLLRPDAGTAHVLGHDVWSDTVRAKQLVGVLPDGLRLFDRLTGLQLICYSGLLRGMDRTVVTERAHELLEALGLAEATGTLVVDYSAGMTKKISLACALIHAPRLLVQSGCMDQGTGERDLLRHARRVVNNQSAGRLCQAKSLQQLMGSFGDHRAIHAAQQARVADELQPGQA